MALSSLEALYECGPESQEWPRTLVVAFGFLKPFVARWYAKAPDGETVCYREIRIEEAPVEYLAAIVRRLSQGETYSAVLCDLDAEDRIAFERITGWGAKVAGNETLPEPPEHFRWMQRQALWRRYEASDDREERMRIADEHSAVTVRRLGPEFDRNAL